MTHTLFCKAREKALRLLPASFSCFQKHHVLEILLNLHCLYVQLNYNYFDYVEITTLRTDCSNPNQIRTQQSSNP